MKIAKDTFKEIIGIIKLCCRNASCSFIHCMAENVSSINEQEKKKICFYPKAPAETLVVLPQSMGSILASSLVILGRPGLL